MKLESGRLKDKSASWLFLRYEEGSGRKSSDAFARANEMRVHGQRLCLKDDYCVFYSFLSFPLKFLLSFHVQKIR